MKDQIVRTLDALEAAGVIRSWQLQGNMPGNRWTIEAPPIGTRSYTTVEAAAFCDAVAITWVGP